MGKRIKKHLGLAVMTTVTALVMLTGCNKGNTVPNYGQYGAYGNYSCPNPGGAALYPAPITSNFTSPISGQSFSINWTFSATQQNSLAINAYATGTLPDLAVLLQGYPLQNNTICLSNINGSGSPDSMTSWLDPNTGIRGVQGNVYGSYQLSSQYGNSMYGGYGGISPYGYNPGQQTQTASGPTITGVLGQNCQSYVVPNVRLAGCLTLTVNPPGVYGATSGQPITYQSQ